jgi:hypothetical protein
MHGFTVPFRNELPAGTLRSIAEDAGAKDIDTFCARVDRYS